MGAIGAKKADSAPGLPGQVHPGGKPALPADSSKVYTGTKNAPKKITPQDIPSYSKNPAEFEAWFDKQTPEELAEYWKDPQLKAKIKNELLGPGGEHEYLMRAEAPKWKEWGVTARELREKYSVAFDELDKMSLFKHSRGTRGSLAPGSGKAHIELRKIIQDSKSLEEFKKNLVPWADKWLKDGVRDLPTDLR